MNVELGDRVEHPRYGGGQIVALYRNGEEWMVRFDSGLRFRRDRHEFCRRGDHACRRSGPVAAARTRRP